MISAALMIMLAGLSGWIIGLTAHAFLATRWRDPGARVAWAVGASATAGGTLLASLALCLVTRPTVFLLAIPVSLSAGAIGAWRASELLRVPGLDVDPATGTFLRDPPSAPRDGARKR